MNWKGYFCSCSCYIVRTRTLILLAKRGHLAWFRSRVVTVRVSGWTVHYASDRPHNNRSTNVCAYPHNVNITVKLKTCFSLCTHRMLESWQDREYTHTHAHRFWVDYRLHRCFCFSWPLHPFFVITLSITELCCPSLRLSGTRSKAEPLRASLHFHSVQHKYAQHSQHSQSVGWALEAHSHVSAHIYNQLGSIRSFVLMHLLGSDRYLALSVKRLCRRASLGVNQPISFYKNNTVNSLHLF